VNDWGYLDTLGAWDEAADMPEQLIRALETARSCVHDSDVVAPPSPRAVVAFAQGTGATACEAAVALTAGQLKIPFAVVRSGSVPAYVDEHTLAFAVSTSGETGEVIEGGAGAATRGARLVGIGAEGPESSLTRLVSAAEAVGGAWCPLRGVATPRSQLAAMTVSVVTVLAECGLVTERASSVMDAAAALARRRDAWLVPGGQPEELARRLGRTIPLVYGAEGIAAVAARWWKAGVNLNAKAPAFAASLPPLTYDEIAGWGQGGDITRQTMSLVFLRHAGESSGMAPLFERVRAATDEIMADLYEVDALGDDDLSRFFDLALFGELVSLHLAGREGVDPGPTPAIEDSPSIGDLPE
jgi:glucose/mannose-6-phosphate isomerase